MRLPWSEVCAAGVASLHIGSLSAAKVSLKEKRRVKGLAGYGFLECGGVEVRLGMWGLRFSLRIRVGTADSGREGIPMFSLRTEHRF